MGPGQREQLFQIATGVRSAWQDVEIEIKAGVTVGAGDLGPVAKAESGFRY